VQEQPAGKSWENADEIDLTRYIGALASRWPEILLTMLAVVLLTALAVLAYRALTPPIYEATATAAIVRTLTDVRFDERFTTSSEQDNLDVNSRRMALIALVSSGSIVQQVIAELGEALPPKLRDPAELLEIVRGEMALAGGRTGQSDLINITVRADSPELSALIANAWAKAYVQQVNSVYGQVPDEMLSTVAAQLDEAQQTYARAQEQLETHLATSPLEALIRQSHTISETLNATQGLELRINHEQWLRTNNLLTAARTLGEQVSGSGAVEDADLASVALALQVLQTQMVNAAAAPLPAMPQQQSQQQPQQQSLTILQPQSTLQLQLDNAAPTSLAALRAEVAAAIAGLETQLAELESRIAQAAQTLTAGSAPEADAETDANTAGDPLAAATTQLEEQLRALQSGIEVEQARTLAFTEQRDLAWDSVQALNNKQAEMLLARAAANSEVRLSSAAVPLNKPVEQISLVVSLGLAAIIGLLLGVLMAFVLEVMNVRPLRARGNAA
jgi:uncharacterized protein involved in exopolysaccharide biosynthesis